MSSCSYFEEESVTYHIEWRFLDLQSTKQGSWSENWYGEGASAAQVLASYAAPIDVRKRLQILSTDYGLKYVNVRNLTNRFDSAVQTFVGNTGNGIFISPGSDESKGEPGWDRLQCKLLASGNTGGHAPVPFTTVRQFALGGLPEGVLVDTTNFVGSNGWLALFNQWKANLLQAPNNEVRHVLLSANPVPNIQLITIGTDLRSINVNFLTANDPLWTIGQVIKVSGTVNTAGVNKYWRVKAITIVPTISTTYYMYPGRQTVVGTIAPPWNVNTVSYVYGAVVACDPIRGMERKVGRFPVAYRGHVSRRGR
jgi:hypothetical protein